MRRQTSGWPQCPAQVLASLAACLLLFKYRFRANMAGTIRVGPATVQSMYAPEFNAYSAGHVLTVVPAQ